MDEIFSQRIDLIEAILFQVLRFQTPLEAAPFVARRIANRMGCPDEADAFEREIGGVMQERLIVRQIVASDHARRDFQQGE